MIAVTSHRREDASQRGWQYRLHLDAPMLLALIGTLTACGTEGGFQVLHPVGALTLLAVVLDQAPRLEPPRAQREALCRARSKLKHGARNYPATTQRQRAP